MSLTPHEHPNMDRCIVKVLAPFTSAPECDTTVNQDGDMLKVVSKAESPEKNKGVATVITMPMTHNIDVDSKLKSRNRARGRTQCFHLAASESTSASIEAENFIESDFCNLTSKAGGITAAGIKSDKISLASVSGDIECSGLVQASFPPLLHTIYSFVAYVAVNLYTMY